jgi:predicted DNA-binding transcriptional regulator AlpA
MHAKLDLGVGNLLEAARERALLEKAGSLLRQELEKERKVTTERESVLLEKAVSTAKEELEKERGPGLSKEAALRASFAEKAREDGLVTRDEVAAFLRVSCKTVQRMDADGRLPRCRNLGTAVRYRARDVQRLDSAMRKEARNAEAAEGHVQA